MVAGLLLSGLFLDFLTLLFLWPLLLKKYGKRKYSVSIIIPAYNEERNIEGVIRCALNQTLPPREVIVIDDNSKDNTARICERLTKVYPRLKLIKQKQNMGKAFNTSYVIKNYGLGEITLILDSDTFLSRNYIQEVTRPFSNLRVAIVTGMSLPIKQRNLVGEIIYHGSYFQYRFFSFRKTAQSLRNAVSVISGDSAAYRTIFLKKMGGLPQGTETEDMDITWRALERGYRVVYRSKAVARSKDAPTLRGHIKQVSRWYKGSFQNFYRHGFRLFKAWPLLFTTLIPFFLDSVVYAPLLLASPLFYPYYPKFVLGFYLADLIFTTIVLIIIDPKGILHLPSVYFIKLLWAIIWLYAGFITTLQVIFGKRRWGGTWKKTRTF